MISTIRSSVSVKRGLRRICYKIVVFHSTILLDMPKPATKARAILDLNRQGYRSGQIAQQLQTTQRYVDRVIGEFHRSQRANLIERMYDLICEQTVLLRKIARMPASVIDKRIADLREEKPLPEITERDLAL